MKASMVSWFKNWTQNSRPRIKFPFIQEASWVTFVSSTGAVLAAWCWVLQMFNKTLCHQWETRNTGGYAHTSWCYIGWILQRSLRWHPYWAVGKLGRERKMGMGGEWGQLQRLPLNPIPPPKPRNLSRVSSGRKRFGPESSFATEGTRHV